VTEAFVLVLSSWTTAYIRERERETMKKRGDKKKVREKEIHKDEMGGEIRCERKATAKKCI